jgi:hypothetical protein
MPNAVELSVRRGVGGCVWPSSVSVALSGAPLWALWKHAPTSDSAAEATTFFYYSSDVEDLSVKCVLFQGFVAQEKHTSESDSYVGEREVRGIAVDVRYHVGGVIPDGGVGLSG